MKLDKKLKCAIFVRKIWRAIKRILESLVPKMFGCFVLLLFLFPAFYPIIYFCHTLIQDAKEERERIAEIEREILHKRGARIDGAEIVDDWSGVRYGSDRYVLGGVPVKEGLKLLLNEGYLVGYDEEMKNPAWVAYSLGCPKTFNTGKRMNFKIDSRTLARVRPDDYAGTEFNRGHMAPNQAIGVVYGEEAQRETFLMSNILPQDPDLNTRVWRELERKSLENYTQDFGRIWVVCGAVYGEEVEYLTAGVAIPEAFFLILTELERRTGNLRTLAFIVPNKPNLSKNLGDYLVSIDEIEERTGIDFFAELSEVEQAEIESKRAKKIW